MRLPFFMLLVLAAAGLAADGPRGFLGVPWGASPEEAKRTLQTRPGVRFPENSDDFHVELTGGTFAGQPVEKWVLEFPERKFGSAAVTLKTEGNASSIYKEIREQLVVTVRYVDESLVAVADADSDANARPVRVPVKKEDL